MRLADAVAADLAAKLAKTTLVAPVDGRVRLLVAEPGEVISPGQSIMTLEAGRERWFTFTVREDRLGGVAIGAPLWLRTSKGERIEARVTELRPLGEFATWRAARAVGDHDINSFLVRADPVAETEGLEPGMTVWIDRGRAAFVTACWTLRPPPSRRLRTAARVSLRRLRKGTHDESPDGSHLA